MPVIGGWLARGWLGREGMTQMFHANTALLCWQPTKPVASVLKRGRGMLEPGSRYLEAQLRMAHSGALLRKNALHGDINQDCVLPSTLSQQRQTHSQNRACPKLHASFMTLLSLKNSVLATHPHAAATAALVEKVLLQQGQCNSCLSLYKPLLVCRYQPMELTLTASQKQWWIWLTSLWTS